MTTNTKLKSKPIKEIWGLSSPPATLQTHLAGALASANQLADKLKRLRDHRDTALIRAAIAHNALSCLFQALTDDPAAQALSPYTHAIITEAQTITEPDTWEHLLHQFQTMTQALTRIAAQGDPLSHNIAQRTLAEIETT